MDEADRRKRLERLRPADAPEGYFISWCWSDRDLDRLRTAFQVRFDEPVPRTETLMAAAAEGIRIWIERQGDSNDS